MIDESSDPGDVKADGGAGRCRHLSPLYNPPEKFWKAYRKLVIGVCWRLEESRGQGQGKAGVKTGQVLEQKWHRKRSEMTDDQAQQLVE